MNLIKEYAQTGGGGCSNSVRGNSCRWILPALMMARVEIEIYNNGIRGEWIHEFGNLTANTAYAEGVPC